MVVRVFIGLKIFAATPRRRDLRSDEACLCNGVEIFVVVYPKVGKEQRSGVVPYAAANLKAIPQKKSKIRNKKFMFAMQRHRVLRYCIPESMIKGFSSFLKTRI